MIHGLDTGFLVAAEIREHLDHAAVRRTLGRLVNAGDLIGIAPQVVAEFIHVVADARRFSQPQDIASARDLAKLWWTARDAVQVFPDDSATQFLAWHEQFSLGRKRLLDTQLAATYSQARISSLLTTNANDFNVFRIFTCLAPGD